MNFYSPFDHILQSKNRCLLSGKPTNDAINIFPIWFLKAFDLEDKPFKFIDDEWATYSDLKMPINMDIWLDHWQSNDEMVRSAFDGGYDAVVKLPENQLFRWLGRMLYGLVYIEMKREAKENSSAAINPSLQSRYEALAMLLQAEQNKYRIDFDPASIIVLPIDNQDAELVIKDELNTLCVSIIYKNFAITACLADNGRINQYLTKTLKQIENRSLNLLQFEEVNAMLYYTAWLYEPELDYYFDDNSIEWMPNNATNIFKKWDDKVLAQVLENFWKRFGLTKFEILPYGAEKPMTYLT